MQKLPQEIPSGEQTNISYPMGTGKSSTQKCVGKGNVSFQEGSVWIQLSSSTEKKHIFYTNDDG